MPSPFLMDFAKEPDLSHRVRRMRTFEDLFERTLEQINAVMATEMTSDRARLRAAFLTWLDNFGQTRPFANVNRRDFVNYSAGRMFAELIRHHVVSAEPGDRNSFEPADIWPEGYAYANFCLSIALNVLAQDGHDSDAPIGLLRDQRVWQSFRENALDNPDIAVAFFDLILGNIPNWSMPQLVERRPAMRRPRRHVS
jgi:hypothetical protein